MEHNNYRYCKVFVDGVPVDTAKTILGKALGGTFECHTMYVSLGLAVDVRRNTDATEGVDSSDDFVYWPVLVEVDAEESVADRAVVETTSRILNTLWDAGHRAVAACDFEDELPWSGGIQRLR
jgi:hypothetical protein